MNEFLRNLRKSNLLTPEQWETVRAEVRGGPEVRPGDDDPDRGVEFGANDPDGPFRMTPAELARQLVERGWITLWQSERLLQRKTAFFLGKYRLLERIGSGGSGAVFKARQGQYGRTVAIKVLSAEVVMKNRRAVARFRQEIQAVAALNDPHIVAAYDAGSSMGIHYLVMEYVEGNDLGYLVKQNGALPVAWACECIRQAALGLQYAHEQGMVHRDIKPSNLLVAKDESDRPLVKILDLGLARFVSETISGEPTEMADHGKKRTSDGSLTQLGQFLGTPDYISPEQAQNTRSADIRSDIFSLGCTLFRLLTGQLPFAGETLVQKIEARETTDALRVRSLRGEVPIELDAVVARMLAHDPESRFQTPRAVADALARFTGRTGPLPAPKIEESGGNARQSAPGEEARLEALFKSLASVEAEHTLSIAGFASHLARTPQRKWLLAGGAGLTFLTAFLIWDWLSSATIAIDWPPEAREGAALEVNERLVRLVGRQPCLVEGRPGTFKLRLVREGYETVEKTVTLHRGERIDFTPAWRPNPQTRRRRKLQSLTERLTAAARTDVRSPVAAGLRADILSFLRRYPTSPEGRSARELAAQMLWPLDLLAADGAGIIPSPQTPADLLPQRVAVFGDSRLKAWNTITAVATSGDSQLLAAASLDGTVQVFETADGRQLQLLTAPVVPTEVAFRPGTTTLAIAGATGPVSLWNAVDGNCTATLSDTSAPIAFSPDGSLLATGAARQEIALWDAQNGELRRTMSGHPTGILRGLVFSPQGKMLASHGSESTVVLWDVASGQQRRRFANAQSPLFSPDDAFLAAGTTNGDLVLWDTRTGETRRTLDDGGRPLAFTSGGATIVSKRLGRAVVWNMAGGEELRTIVEVPELARVSPDGTWLAGGDDAFGEVRLWNLARGGPRRDMGLAGPATALSFGDDSATIVVGTRAYVVQTFDVASGAERTPAEPLLAQADLSPDGGLLAVRRGSEVELVDVSTGETRRTLSGNAAQLEALAFCPDGRVLAGFGGWGLFTTSLRLWETANGRELPLAGAPPGTVRTMAYSADATLLACAGDSRIVTIWDVARHAERETLGEFSDRVTAIAYHPDGRRLAIACSDKTLLLWDTKTASGRPLPTQGGVCRQLVFTAEGTLLAGAIDRRVLVWNIDHGQRVTELATGDWNAASIAFDPAGKRLIAGGNDGEVWEWDDPGGEKARAAPDRVLRVGPPKGIVRQVMWGLDGRHILTVNGNGTVYVLRLAPPPGR